MLDKIWSGEGDEIDPDYELRQSLENTADKMLFCFQFAVLFVSTLVPLWAAKLLHSKTSFQVDATSVTFSYGNTPIFEIDQRQSTVKPLIGKKLWRPWVVWLPLTLINPRGESVFVSMKWTALGFRKKFCYKYRYSIVQEGTTTFLLGDVSCLSRMHRYVESKLVANVIRPAEECMIEIVSPRTPIVVDSNSYILNIYGVPPYIPEEAFN